MYMHEEILLLVLKDDSGTVDWHAGMFQFVMAGSLIAELVLDEHIGISEDKKLISVLRTTHHENQVLDSALSIIKKDTQQKDIKHWVTTLAMMKNLKERTAKSLCLRGILKEETVRILLFFKRKSYPVMDPEPEEKLIARIEDAVFAEGEVDVRTTILISLIHHSGILSIIFEHQDLHKHKERIHAIARGELIGEATGSAIVAVQSAIAMVALMPVITSAS